jgi:PiT family inorganic phosphate transporter
VAGTIGKGIIDPNIVDISVIIGALSGAIAWNLLTWWWGLPSSSSHALVGGLIGAGVSKAGLGILGWQKISITALFIVVSPVVGYIGSALMTIGCSWLLRRMNPGKVDRWFRRLQLVSAAAFSLNHGGNDAQKTMGIIVVLLYSQGYLGTTFPRGTRYPKWIVIGCYLAMGLGTMSGGWRIVKTMGMRLTKLRPFGGFCAETGGSVAIFVATMLGIPGLDNPHHHRGHRRRGFDLQPGQSALGRGGPNRVGVDFHHSGIGSHQRRRLLRCTRLGGLTRGCAC